MNSKRIEVEQEPRVLVSSKVLAQSIVAIAKSTQHLLAGGLTRDALAILIHHNMPAAKRISQRDILAVLDASASLDNFVTKEPAPAKAT